MCLSPGVGVCVVGQGGEGRGEGTWECCLNNATTRYLFIDPR